MLEELTNFVKSVENFESLKPSGQIDFFGYFFVCIQNQPFFTPKQIELAFEILRLLPHSNVSQYLARNSSRSSGRKVKFIRNKEGFHLLGIFEKELKSKVIPKEVDFIDFAVNHNSLNCNPSDVPFLNSKVKKNADFFSKMYFILYHLENSIRKFLKIRLSSILGSSWEDELVNSIDLTKALSIRTETNLSEMLQDRGDSILFYCMWDDYGKIIRKYPHIFKVQRECDEVLAHLGSLTKVRNAIAHNTATIPKEYQDELTLFLSKYIKIMKGNSL
ncbi:MAG TPA: hypothetical protein VGN64_04115 [Dyadobacter sp.]|jgi:hypothetical protein|nr:hypothetical protein [Dyadobacter sp.]